MPNLRILGEDDVRAAINADTALDLATVTKAACDDAKPGKARDAGEPESVGPTGNGASKSAAGKARGGHGPSPPGRGLRLARDRLKHRSRRYRRRLLRVRWIS